MALNLRGFDTTFVTTFLGAKKLQSIFKVVVVVLILDTKNTVAKRTIDICVLHGTTPV
jgi:hypothetical protein